MTNDLDRQISEILETYSARDIRVSLSKVAQQKSDMALTVVVNFGMHALPESILSSDVFYFSEGNVDLSADGVNETVSVLSKRAIKYLRKKVWSKIYLVPSGHPLLVVLSTLIVYRVTRVNPIIVYYVDGEYREVAIDVRAESLRANSLR